MKPLSAMSLFLAVLSISGCALSPQTINIQPQVALEDVVPRGDGRALALTVTDERKTRVVGTRGGVYAATSEISTAADIRPAIRDELARQLDKLGFRVVDSGAEAATLKVIVDSIEYRASGSPVVDTVETAATVRVQAQVSNREYSGRYRGTRTTEVFTAPDTEENEAMINAAVARVLERLLSDTELQDFLRGS